MSEPGGPPFAGALEGRPSLLGEIGADVEGLAGSNKPPGVAITITR
jgi:hypothetical protein